LLECLELERKDYKGVGKSKPLKMRNSTPLLTLSKGKLEGLKDLMNSAIHGVRRIANEFNIDMQRTGKQSVFVRVVYMKY